MTDRQGVFPPKLRNGSEHFLRCGGDPVTCVWVGRGWMIPGYTTLRTSDDLMAAGWTYLGPAATYERAQADAADARRFRWLAEKSIPFFNGFQLHLESKELDIRAAIDAEMGEKP